LHHGIAFIIKKEDMITVLIRLSHFAIEFCAGRPMWFQF